MFLIYLVLVPVQLEEQQAFERSRRFLRQLEISFGDNPTHYHKIIRALQTGPDPSPAHIQEVHELLVLLMWFRSGLVP